MFQYIIKRILIFIPTLFVISLVVFILNLYAPGDPVERMLVQTSGQQGSMTNKVAGEEQYLAMRKELNLDLPTFYFTLSSKAYPDTLYRISRQRHREMLGRMIEQYGNWDEIQPYYHELTDLDYAISGVGKDSLNSNALIKLRSAVNDLFIYYKDAKIQRTFKALEKNIAVAPSTQTLKPQYEKMKAQYEKMRDNPTTWKRYIPAIHYFGLENQYHIWLFGDRPWFPDNEDILAKSSDKLNAVEQKFDIPVQKGGFYQFSPNLKVIENNGRKTGKALEELDIVTITVKGKKKDYSIAKLAEEPLIIQWRDADGTMPVLMKANNTSSIFNFKLGYDLVVTHLKDYNPNNTFGGFLRFDFGKSYQDKRPISHKIGDAIWWTMLLSIISILLTYLIAIPIGVFSARNNGTTADGIVTTILFMFYSLPNFWIATLLIIFLCQPDYLDIFPPYGVGNPPEDISFFGMFQIRAYHLVLPLFCWTYPSLAFLSRQMRGGMLSVLRQDYIRTARAKGLEESKVIWKHTFRNSLLPIITLFANVFPRMISGSIVIEVIFTIPGMGSTLFEAIKWPDFPMVFTVVMLAAILTMIGYLIADILYALVDPRITYK